MYYFMYEGTVFGIKGDECKKIVSQDEIKEQPHIHEFADTCSFDDVLSCAKTVSRNDLLARHAIEEKKYEEASMEFEKAANALESIGDMENAVNYYAFAAIMKENSEKWRNISYLWYKASGEREKLTEYTDVNGVQHVYLTISFDRWKKLNDKEKRARAIQYAAYHEDNFGGPTDSYWLYEKAVKAYEEAGNTERLIECLVSATNRYVKQYNMVSDEIVKKWKTILKRKLTMKQKEMISLAFNEIYRNMNMNGSENSTFFYIQTKKMQNKMNFARKKYLRGVLGCLHGFSSDYGTNGIKIMFHAVIMVLIFFPFLFWLSGAGESLLSAISCSLNSFFGIKHFEECTTIRYWLGISEVIYSYFVLVIIGTYLVNKIVKNMT